MSKIRAAIFTALMFFMVSIPLAAQTTTAAESAPTRVSSADQEKRLTKRVNPSYPKEAFEAKMTGIINLETIIGMDGKVTSVRLLGKGEDLLVKAAMDAVKQWVYKPYKVDGKPVPVITIVAINFKVGDQ